MFGVRCARAPGVVEKDPAPKYLDLTAGPPDVAAVF
jgi:hypothetical protein